MSGMAHAPPPPICPKVCIFDIDNTVTVGADHNEKICPVVSGPPPAWPSSGSGTTAVIKQAVKKCLNKGYKVGFASAESQTEEDNATQRSFIASLAPNGEFDQSFLDSDAVQSSWKILAQTPADKKLEYPHKEAMLLNVMRYYKVEPGCFGQSILFDDQTENLCAAHALGMKSVQASPECAGFYCTSGCGIPPSALNAI